MLFPKLSNSHKYECSSATARIITLSRLSAIDQYLTDAIMRDKTPPQENAGAELLALGTKYRV